MLWVKVFAFVRSMRVPMVIWALSLSFTIWSLQTKRSFRKRFERKNESYDWNDDEQKRVARVTQFVSRDFYNCRYNCLQIYFYEEGET